MSVVEIGFDQASPDRLRRAGYQIDFRSRRRFPAAFALEKPCVLQSQVHTDLPFAMGAFSASYGGHLRAVRIGRYCSIAGDVQIGRDDHPVDWVTSSMAAYVSDVHQWASFTGFPGRGIETRFASMRGITMIGHDVWIGYGVFVRPGVTVGDGAIIAARSVVLEDVAPYTIVGGTPAHVIRLRYPAEIVDELSKLAWWRYNIFEFEQAKLADPAGFVGYFKALQARGALPEIYKPGFVEPQDLARLAEVDIRTV